MLAILLAVTLNVFVDPALVADEHKNSQWVMLRAEAAQNAV